MIVEIDALGVAVRGIPLEDQAPLLADPDRMPPREIASQFFKVVAGRCSKIGVQHRIVNKLQLSDEPRLDIGGNSLAVNIADLELT